MKVRTCWLPALLGSVLLTGSVLTARETEPKTDEIKPTLPQEWVNAMVLFIIPHGSFGRVQQAVFGLLDLESRLAIDP